MIEVIVYLVTTVLFNQARISIDKEQPSAILSVCYAGHSLDKTDQCSFEVLVEHDLDTLFWGAGFHPRWDTSIDSINCFNTSLPSKWAKGIDKPYFITVKLDRSSNCSILPNWLGYITDEYGRHFFSSGAVSEKSQQSEKGSTMAIYIFPNKEREQR